MLRIFFLLIGLIISSCLAAQVSIVPTPATGADTLHSPDTSAAVYPVDTVSRRPITLFSNSGRNLIDSLPLTYQLMSKHPFYSFNTPAVSSYSDIRRFEGKELLFYVVTALVMVFGLLKLGFSKYFNDLFRVFFRTTLKQRQIREQLMQTPFPSLVFIGFFVASAGLYLTLLFQHFEITPIENFWLLYLYCCIGLSVIYLVKFVGLIICGWLFNMRKAADSYIFIVFIINKVIGIALVPFIVLLAFSDEIMYNVALVLSWCTVGALFLYRFILGFAAIRNEVRFNLFHFFLYLCAFEIAPLLLIYKLLLFFF